MSSQALLPNGLHLDDICLNKLLLFRLQSIPSKNDFLRNAAMVEQSNRYHITFLSLLTYKVVILCVRCGIVIIAFELVKLLETSDLVGLFKGYKLLAC